MSKEIIFLYKNNIAFGSISDYHEVDDEFRFTVKITRGELEIGEQVMQVLMPYELDCEQISLN